MNQQIITLSETAEGNLRIDLDNTEEAREELKDLMDKHPDNTVWWELLEPYYTNGGYSLISPETIGALTESPIIASEPVSWDDNEDMYLHKDAKTWWFPDYMVRSELGELLEKGFVIFVKAD